MSSNSELISKHILSRLLFSKKCLGDTPRDCGEVDVCDENRLRLKTEGDGHCFFRCCLFHEDSTGVHGNKQFLQSSCEETMQAILSLRERVAAQLHSEFQRDPDMIQVVLAAESVSRDNLDPFANEEEYLKQLSSLSYVPRHSPFCQPFRTRRSRKRNKNKQGLKTRYANEYEVRAYSKKFQVMVVVHGDPLNKNIAGKVVYGKEFQHGDVPPLHIIFDGIHYEPFVESSSERLARLFKSRQDKAAKKRVAEIQATMEAEALMPNHININPLFRAMFGSGKLQTLEEGTPTPRSELRPNSSLQEAEEPLRKVLLPPTGALIKMKSKLAQWPNIPLTSVLQVKDGKLSPPSLARL